MVSDAMNPVKNAVPDNNITFDALENRQRLRLLALCQVAARCVQSVGDGSPKNRAHARWRDGESRVGVSIQHRDALEAEYLRYVQSRNEWELAEDRRLGPVERFLALACSRGLVWRLKEAGEGEKTFPVPLETWLEFNNSHWALRKIIVKSIKDGPSEGVVEMMAQLAVDASEMPEVEPDEPARSPVAEGSKEQTIACMTGILAQAASEIGGKSRLLPETALGEICQAAYEAMELKANGTTSA